MQKALADAGTHFLCNFFLSFHEFMIDLFNSLKRDLMANHFKTPHFETLPSSFETVSFDDHFQIATKQVLFEHKTSFASAYAVLEDGKPSDTIMAYVTDSSYPIQKEIVRNLMALDYTDMIRIVNFKKVKWLSDETFQFAVLVKKPEGEKFLQSGQMQFPAYTINDLERYFVKPILSFLRYLDSKQMSHGNINPYNLYFKNEKQGPLMLGENFMAPADFSQKLIFEPSDRAIAQYTGKGSGGSINDVYTLGVTIFSLITGQIPLANLKTEEMLKIKLERGSYSAFTKAVEIPASLNELFRGTLNDDADNRWTLEEVENWFSDHKQNSKQIPKNHRAARYYEFEGEQYIDTKSIAVAFGIQPNAALKAIENGVFLNWLKRSFTNHTIYQSIDDLIKGDGNQAPKVDNLTLTEICMTLDQSLPIFYKDLRLLPMGLGTALMEAFLFKKNPALFLELFSNNIPQKWLSNQNSLDPQMKAIKQNLDTAASFVEKKGPGLGLERLLYELNPDLYCLSPKVIHQKVLTLAELLFALEENAKSKEYETDPIDQHILAFLADRQNKVDAYYLSQLSGDFSPEAKAAALTYILAESSRVAHIESLPNLGNLLLHKLRPFIQKLHDTDMQKTVSKTLEEHATNGNLLEMAKLVMDEDLLTQDVASYELAQEEYDDITQSIESLKTVIKNPNIISKTIGKHIAVLVSVICASIFGASMVIKLVTS